MYDNVTEQRKDFVRQDNIKQLQKILKGRNLLGKARGLDGDIRRLLYTGRNQGDVGIEYDFSVKTRMLAVATAV